MPHYSRIAGLLVLVLAGCAELNEGRIKREIPLGSTLESVKQYAVSEIRRTNNKNAQITPLAKQRNLHSQTATGTNVLRVYYGVYRGFPFSYLIYFDYVFDQDGVLVEVFSGCDMT